MEYCDGCYNPKWNCNCIDHEDLPTGGNTMNITFSPADPRPVLEENITIDGAVIGTIKPWESNGKTRFHAHLSIPVASYRTQSVSGFGDTKEEAIQNAIETGKADITTCLEKLAELEEKING